MSQVAHSAEAELKAAYWWCSEIASEDAAGNRYWLVLAQRGGQRVVGKGSTASEAWPQAAERAQTLEDAGP